ncbi:hypothetical protein VNO80_25732 [Phaseolus coccineus]|uniref:Uncharacterized protein n=1 Tax=Phaseolus coccineus TaxID=3886 RepID=A0AAN9LVT8_PHACN
MSSSSFSSFAYFSSSGDSPLLDRDVNPIWVGSLSNPSDSFSIQGDSLEVESVSVTVEVMPITVRVALTNIPSRLPKAQMAKGKRKTSNLKIIEIPETTVVKGNMKGSDAHTMKEKKMNVTSLWKEWKVATMVFWRRKRG